MEVKLGGNGFEYTFLEDGTYFYKAMPIKKVSMEQPAFKIIEEIENNYLKAFTQRIRFAVRDIQKYLQ